MLEIPTPESLEAEANELEALAKKKERHAASEWISPFGQQHAKKDAAIFREEAQAKRAKAERMRKAEEFKSTVLLEDGHITNCGNGGEDWQDCSPECAKARRAAQQ